MQSFLATADHIIETTTITKKMPSMHYHTSYELYYLEMGSREYFVEDKLFSVAAGEFVLIAPGKLHRTGGEQCVRTLINFTKEFLCRYLAPDAVEQMLVCFENPKIVPTERQQGGCKQLLRRLAASADETEFALTLGLLLLTLGRCGSEEIENDYVSTVVEYINGHFAQITSIGQIAEAFFVSKYHLCRVFKNAMKLTIIEYLNQVKIKNARQMLEFSDREVGDIAELCGFNSVAYFSNVFKKITGMAPSEYRKNTRGDK